MGLVPPAPGTAHQEKMQGEVRRDHVEITAPGGYRLTAWLYRLPDAQVRPLLILNHGSPANPARMREMVEPNRAVAERFARLGLVVLCPIRRGFGRSDGPCVERPPFDRPATSADYLASARAAADDIGAALQAVPHDEILSDPNAVILMGTSAGGLASIAFAGRQCPGIRAVVSIAGGRGVRSDGSISGGEAELGEAFAILGAGNKVSQLWLYAANDTAFPPDRVAFLTERYSAGAFLKPKVVILPSLALGGHALIERPGHWEDEVVDFLEASLSAGGVTFGRESV
ncbi:MAG: alpha/beta hydrolase [Alphaproteobacteria bacterium]|jgi:dienelactone hydrolase